MAHPARETLVGSTSIGRPSFARLKTLATALNHVFSAPSAGRPLAMLTASADVIGATRYSPVAPLMPLRMRSSSFTPVLSVGAASRAALRHGAYRHELCRKPASAR